MEMLFYWLAYRSLYFKSRLQIKHELTLRLTLLFSSIAFRPQD